MTASTSQQQLGGDGRSEDAPPRLKAAEKAYQSEMMFIGEQCHLDDCHREDFLPFRCPDCHHQYCSDHYKTVDHRCAKASVNFLVPLCPLCHEPPKNWKRDEDPNIAMNNHLSPDSRLGGRIECSAIDERGAIREDAKGRTSTKGRREKKPNECQERRCRKLMIVPIQCPACSAQFCPSHRATVQHDCPSLKQKTSAAGTKSTPGRQSQNIKSSNHLSTLVPKMMNNFTSANSKESISQSETHHDAQTSSSLSSSLNPLQAISSARKDLRTDKRARSEHASALKALQARHAKGLLSPAEQVRLAEEMALEQKGKAHGRGNNKDCVIV